MHFNMERASPGTCASGTGTYYVCESNGFTGCCTIDPCSLSTCPDTASIANSASSTTSTATSTFAVKTLTVITESVSTQSSSSSISTAIAATTTSSLQNALVVSQTATPSPTQTSSPAPVSSNTHIVLIAAVVPVIVVLSLLSILGWFCLRRCRQRKDAREVRESYGIPSKQDYVLDRTISDGMEVETIQKPDNDIFASFGGRYKSPKAGRAEMAPIPVHNPSQGQSLSIERNNEDQPLPDPEKTGLTPPPVHEHPAYQGLSSQSPEIPVYHQSQARHSPAPLSYPGSAVSQKADQGNFSPLARITNVQDEYSPSYPARNLQGRQNSTPLSPHMEVVSPIISSPVPGHMELEGDAPAHFNSPMISPVNTPAPRQSAHFVQNKSTETLSKPVGLGLGVPRTSNPTPAPLQMPSTFVPASKPQTQHQHHHHSYIPRISTCLPHLRTASSQKFFMSEEVVSKIQVAENISPTSLRPTPRSSLQSLNQQQGQTHTQNPNPNQPTISHLQPVVYQKRYNGESSRRPNHDTLKEVVSPSSPERWSDITMVGNTPVTAITPMVAVSHSPSLVPDALLPLSSNQVQRQGQGQQQLQVPAGQGHSSGVSGEKEGEGTGESPTSTYTEDGTNTWGSWAAR